MTLKIDHAAGNQIESTMESINALRYDAYNPTHVKAESSIDLQATLVFDEKES